MSQTLTGGHHRARVTKTSINLTTATFFHIVKKGVTVFTLALIFAIFLADIILHGFAIFTGANVDVEAVVLVVVDAAEVVDSGAIFTSADVGHASGAVMVIVVVTEKGIR